MGDNGSVSAASNGLDHSNEQEQSKLLSENDLKSIEIISSHSGKT